MTKEEQINLAKTTSDASTIELLLSVGDFDTKLALLNNPNCKDLNTSNLIDNLTLDEIDENFETLITIPSLVITDKIFKIPNLTIKRLISVYNISPSIDIIDKLTKLINDESVVIDADDITTLAPITGILRRLLWRINRSRLHVTEEQIRIMCSTDKGKEIVEGDFYDLNRTLYYFLYKEMHMYKYSLLERLYDDNKLTEDDFIDIMSKLSKSDHESALRAFNNFYNNIPSTFYNEEIFDAYIEQHINYKDLSASDINRINDHINKYSFSNVQLTKLYKKMIDTRFHISNASDAKYQLINTIFSKIDISNADDIIISIADHMESDNQLYSDQEIKFLKKCSLSNEFFMKYGIYNLYEHPNVTVDVISAVFLNASSNYPCELAILNLSKDDTFQLAHNIFVSKNIGKIIQFVNIYMDDSRVDLMIDFITNAKYDYKINCNANVLHNYGYYYKISLNEEQANKLMNATINKDICNAILMLDRNYCVEITKDLDIDTLHEYDICALVDSKYCTVDLLRKLSKDEYVDNPVSTHVIESKLCPPDLLAYWAIKNKTWFHSYKKILKHPNYDQTVNDAIVNDLIASGIRDFMCSGWTDSFTIKFLNKSSYLTREQRIALCCANNNKFDIFYILPDNLTESEIIKLYNRWVGSAFEENLIKKVITAPKCPTKILLKAIQLGMKEAIDHPNITSEILENIVDVCDPKFYDIILCSKCNHNTIIKMVKNGYDDIDKLENIITLKIIKSEEDREKFANAHLAVIDKVLSMIE